MWFFFSQCYFCLDHEYVYHLYVDITNNDSDNIYVGWALEEDLGNDLQLIGAKKDTVGVNKKKRVSISLSSHKCVDHVDLRRYLWFYKLGNNDRSKRIFPWTTESPVSIEQGEEFVSLNLISAKFYMKYETRNTFSSFLPI